MKASVVLAACNGRPFLKDQVNSILPQMKAQDELIISVDPSTDATLELARSLAETDHRIQVLEGPGKGIAANFEHGLQLASGDLIFLCDQDDLWHAGKMDQIQKAFEDPEVLLVLHDVRMVDADGKVLEESYFSYHQSKPGFIANIWRNSFMGCAMAFRKELLSDILPIPQNIPMHDQWIGLAALKKGKVIFLDQVLLEYRRHERNSSAVRPVSSLSQKIRWRISIIRALHGRGYL